ncbi:SIR2 family NAD-dependent protein deacylase [Pseudomonas aeruginosa]
MKLMLITGAGISTGSGLSTYRGADGSYTAIEEELGMPIERALTKETLRNKPDLIWGYLNKFILEIRKAKPSLAHQAISELSRHCDSLLEVTQNVDGLSAAAGVPSEQILEIHGNIHAYECMKCRNAAHPVITEESVGAPLCFACKPDKGYPIRPKIVLFNEMVDFHSLRRAEEFAIDCDALIIAGTSLQFPYLNSIILHAALNYKPILLIDPVIEGIPGNLVLEAKSYGGELLSALRDNMYFAQATADDVLSELANLVKMKGFTAAHLRNFMLSKS